MVNTNQKATHKKKKNKKNTNQKAKLIRVPIVYQENKSRVYQQATDIKVCAHNQNEDEYY